MDDPVAQARACVDDRFPAARAAFLGAGVLSARRTATSDLDIVVLIDGPPAPFRESLIWNGWPVELFVNKASAIGAWFAKDAARRRPTLARMCADGVVLTDTDGTAAAVCEQARAVLAAGPPALDPAERDWRRYSLTDLLDRPLAGGGKWLLRELRDADPALAGRLVPARADPAELTRLADDVLARAGGRLWAGYRQAGKL